MKFVQVCLFTVLWLAGVSQQPQTVMKVDTSMESRIYWDKWMKDLYEMGLDRNKDSLVIREEVVKLVKDSAYRNSIYPEKYDWSSVVSLMKTMELKKAFWQMINIYAADTAYRPLVIGAFIAYDSLMQMDKILINAYYTYAFTDPRVCRIKNGKPEVYRPDLLEKNLLTTKEIINYILYYRNQKTGLKNSKVKKD